MVSKTVVTPLHILYLTLALTPSPQRCVTVVLKADLAWNPPQRYNNRQWSADPTLDASRLQLLLKHSLFVPFSLGMGRGGKADLGYVSVKVLRGNLLVSNTLSTAVPIASPSFPPSCLPILTRTSKSGSTLSLSDPLHTQHTI